MPVGPTSSKRVSSHEHSVSCLPSFLFAPWRLLCCIGRCFKRVFCCGSASHPPSHRSTPQPSARATPSYHSTHHSSGFSSADSSPSLLDLVEVTVWAPKTPLAHRNDGLKIGGTRNKEAPALSEPKDISEAEGSGHKSPVDNLEPLKEEPPPKELEEPADQENEPSVPGTAPSEDPGFLEGLSFPSPLSFFDGVASSVSSLGNFLFGASPSPSKAPVVLGKVEVISPSASGEQHPKIVVEEEESSESEIEPSPHGGLVDIPRPPSSPLAELLGSGALLPQPEEGLLPPPPVPLPDSTLPPPPLEEGLSPLSFPDLPPLPEVIVDDSDLWQREGHPRYSLEQLQLITYLADWIYEEVSSGMSAAWTESLEKAWKKNRLGQGIVYQMLFPEESKNCKALLEELFQDLTKISETLERIKALEEARNQMIADGSWRDGSSKYPPEAVELLTYITRDSFYIETEDLIRSWIFDTLHKSHNLKNFETYCYILGCKTTTDWLTYFGILLETIQNPAKVTQALANAKRVKAHIDEHGDFPAAKREYLEIPEDLKASHPQYSAEALELLTYLPASCVPEGLILLETDEDLDRNRAFWQVQQRNVLSISYIYNLLGCMDREIKDGDIGAVLQERCHQALRDILNSPQRTEEILGKMQEAREYARAHGHAPCIGPTREIVNEIIQHGLSLRYFPGETLTLGIELTSLYRKRNRVNYLLYSANPYSAYSVLLEYPPRQRQELHEKLCNIVYPNSEFIADKVSTLSGREKIDVDEKLLDLFKDISDSNIENMKGLMNGYPTIYQESGITVEGLMEYIHTARGKMDAYKEAKKQLTAAEDLLRECIEKKAEASNTHKTATKGKITREQKSQADTTLKEKHKELDEEKRRLEGEITNLKRQVRGLTQDKGAQESLIAIGMLMGIAPSPPRNAK